jgi:enoyl-CoA hydratase/carnithine racemase
MGAAEVAHAATSALAHERLTARPGGPAIVVDLRDDPARPAPHELGDALAAVPRVLVAVTGSSDGRPADGTMAAALDVVVADETAAREIADRVASHPLAAAALAILLRGYASRSVVEGLVAESSTYSTLQAGPEHQQWLAGRRRRPRAAEEQPAVRVERDGDRLLLTLARPHLRNAFDARTRDELLAGLLVAAADPTVAEIVLTGDGPSFCSGGDLDEFGTTADPASAHLLRLARSVGLALAGVSARVTAQVHGACVGAGVELPAFAGRVVAAPDATFRLPEVAMGLVPGAGGTVSVPRRVGRHRTAWLALSDTTVDAATALSWGLVDEVLAAQDTGP